MNSRRAPGQRLINLAAKSDFIDQIDENLVRCGYADRSQLIRDAMLEKINGVRKEDELPPLPRELALPPGRVGKNKSKKYSMPSASALQLNDKMTGEVVPVGSPISSCKSKKKKP